MQVLHELIVRMVWEGAAGRRSHQVFLSVFVLAKHTVKVRRALSLISESKDADTWTSLVFLRGDRVVAALLAMTDKGKVIASTRRVRGNLLVLVTRIWAWTFAVGRGDRFVAAILAMTCVDLVSTARLARRHDF